MADLSNQNPVADIEAKIVSLKGEKGWAMSCYIPVFNIVTCVLCSIKMVNSKLCLFHARQGLVLFVLWFFTIVVAIISPIISLMLWGVVLLLHISGMVIAYAGNATEIPIIATFAKKIPEDYVFKFLTGKKLDKPDTAPTPTPPVSPSQNPKI
jgi:uncharacterized membrane protein